MEIIRTLRGAGHQAYLVGGAVRDRLLGRPAHDQDVVTDARPDAIAALFPRIVPVGVAFGVVLVQTAEGLVEVATFRREGPYLDGRHPSFVEFATREDDVRRRDFTVNALLYDPVDNQILDLVGGRADLAARRIRTVGTPDARFAEDRLRVLRAIRLAAELEFSIEEETYGAVLRHAPAIREVSVERIRDELLRLLTAPGRGGGLDLLRAAGLLREILPEVAAMDGVPQPPEFHPEGDVFIHTRLALSHLRDPSPALALGVLLHDVGKPPTYEVADRIRFNGHAEMGAEIAEVICGRLRLSSEDSERVVVLVREHLRFIDLPQMRPARRKRFLARPDFPDHLELHRVDCLASHQDLSTWAWAREAAARLTEDERRPPRLLTGEDLIGLGYLPGPRFREMLHAVLDAQLEGTVRSREEALALLTREFPKENTPSERN